MPQQQTPSFLSEAALIEQLKNFVSFPSQQTDLLEEDPKIHDFIRKCAAPRFKEVGADVHFDDHGNLIAQAGPRDAGVSLLFVAYAMTHPANRMTDPFTPRLIETAHGPAVRVRGVAEQKTALTAVLAALGQAIAEDKLKGRLTVVLTTA